MSVRRYLAAAAWLTLVPVLAAAGVLAVAVGVGLLLRAVGWA